MNERHTEQEGRTNDAEMARMFDPLSAELRWKSNRFGVDERPSHTPTTEGDAISVSVPEQRDVRIARGESSNHHFVLKTKQPGVAIYRAG